MFPYLFDGLEGYLCRCYLRQIPIWKIQFYATLSFFIGYLRSGYERKNVFPVTFSNYRLESGQKVSLEDGSPLRDRVSSGGQNGLASWWFVPDHSHGASSSNPLFRFKRLALSVRWNLIFWRPRRDRLWEAFLNG